MIHTRCAGSHAQRVIRTLRLVGLTLGCNGLMTLSAAKRRPFLRQDEQDPACGRQALCGAEPRLSEVLDNRTVRVKGPSSKAAARPPHSNPPHCKRLEGVAQGELDQARYTFGAYNFAEVAGTLYVSGHRIAEIGMIPKVEEVGCESQALPLG